MTGPVWRRRGVPRALVVARARAARSIPRATYRLQLNREFTFRDAAALVPYLAALGVSHVYCSPYLRARPGSMHGYDIIDHNALESRSSAAARTSTGSRSALQAHGMGQILDVVPNHMGVMGADNAWWMDVLENGEASIYAGFFDIDWQPIDLVLRARCSCRCWADHYGVVLERGELRLVFERAGGTFSFTYHEHRFPVDPVSYRRNPGARARAAMLAPGARSELDEPGERVRRVAAAQRDRGRQARRRATTTRKHTRSASPRSPRQIRRSRPASRRPCAH